MAAGRSALWLRWSARQLRQRWVLVGAVALIIAVGTGSYAGLGGTSGWRIASDDASYALLAMHDVRATLSDGVFVPAGELQAAASSIAHADQIASMEERLVVPTLVEGSVDGNLVLVPGRVVGSPWPSSTDLVWVQQGRELGAADADGPVAILESKFAHAVGMPTTGHVRLTGDAPVEYVGVGFSPEYFMILGEQAQWTPEDEYAVLFMQLPAAQRITGHIGEVNDLVLRLSPGADTAVVVEELRTSLGAIGATVTMKEDEFVHRTLYADATNDQRFWNLFALLILAGASLAAFNLITRMVESERREIGVGMALGARPRLLAVRHLLVGLQIALVGTVLGIAVGWLLGLAMGNVLRTFLPLPVWLTPFPTARYLQAALLGVLIPLVAASIPVWRAVRVEPVDALRTGPRATAGGSSRRHRVHPRRSGHADTLRLMPWRNLVRGARRTVLTALGIAAAITTLVGVLGMLDTALGALSQVDRELRHDAPDRLTVSLSTVHPASDPALAALAATAGVAESEPGLRLPVTLIHGERSVDMFVQLLTPDAIWTPTIVAGTSSDSADGVVISSKAASDLGVGPGDIITMRHPRATPLGGYSMVDEPMMITGIHANPLRVFSYMNADQAARFGLTGFVNTIVLTPAPGTTTADLRRAVFQMEGVAGVEETGTLGRLLTDRMGQITGILRILEGLVLGLTLVIAFNSATISGDERAREHATMFAFGVPPRRVMRMMTIESIVTGLIGTLLGIAGGYLAVRWMVNSLSTRVIPELGLDVTISTSTIVTTLALGVFAVAIAPWFTMGRLLKMDVPATLRVLE